MTTTPSIPQTTRHGAGLWALTRIEAAGVIDTVGWSAHGDELEIPFDQAGAVVFGRIAISLDGLPTARLYDTESDAARVVAEVGECDTDWLRARYGVQWTPETEDAPACYSTVGHSDAAFLRALLALVSFAQAALDYGQGCQVREGITSDLDAAREQVRVHQRTIIEQAGVIQRLEAVSAVLTGRTAVA